MNRGENKFKNFWKKFWKIVWKDDSFKGWVISLVFLFVVIKFIFFPLLSLITGTSLPLAIVESCSMYHKADMFGSFNNWWERHDSKYDELNIDKTEFSDFTLRKGFNKGDILFIVRAKPKKLEVGDVIIFNAEQRNPIIHRIISIKQEGEKYIFSTMGDNNNGQLNVETEINEEQLVGRAVFKIMPFLGWGKLVFFEHLRTPSERGLCREQ
jgi:signal peptidase I